MINTSIIIVNWNGREHLEVCFRSLFDQTYTDFEVIFVDNDSRDDSIEYVKKKFPQVRIISAGKNAGFSEGNNIGFRAALQNPDIKYIVVLNNDTETRRDWLEQLIKVVEQNEHIGAVCSKTLFFNQRTIIDSAGDFLLPHSLKVVTRGYKQEDKGQYDKIEECFSCRAAAAIYRREMLEKVQMDGDFFDRYFFAYIEDVDLSVRARLLGWKIVYAPQAVVWHKVSATGKRLSYIFKRYQAGRNRLFTAIKNYPLSLWLTSVRERRSVDSDYRLSVIDAIRVYGRIVGSLIVSLPRLLRQRKMIQRQKKISNTGIKEWMGRFSVER